MWWNLAERAAGKLLDVGFSQLTRPKKSLDDRIREVDRVLEELEEAESDVLSLTKGHPGPPPNQTLAAPIAGEGSPAAAVVTRPGVDAERMAWQGALVRGELWLLEGHLKNNCIGCGGDYECCWKHTANVIDAARETQSMTTDPLYAQAVELAGRIKPLVHPEDVKTGKYRDRYPALAVEVSQIRAQFDARLMGKGRELKAHGVQV